MGEKREEGGKKDKVGVKKRGIVFKKSFFSGGFLKKEIFKPLNQLM